MGYTKTVWNEKSVPGISGAKLNKIEQGIYEAHERIANMQEIPSGGTSADAALYDINIGFDGTNHGAPGDSVRAQAQQLDDKINEVSGQLSSEIANVESALSHDMTLVKSQNLHNFEGDKVGYNIDGNGVVSANTGTTLTGYIPVEVGKVLKYYDSYLNERSMAKVAFYDSDKQFISLKFETKGATIPEGCAYARAVVLTDYYGSDVMFAYETPTKYEPYYEPYYALNVPDLTEELNEVTDEFTDFTNVVTSYRGIQKPINLLIPATMKHGYAINEYGSVFANAGTSVSGFMSVEAGETYKYYDSYFNAANVSKVVFYKENKGILKVSNNISDVLIPDDCKYVRIMVLTEYWNDKNLFSKQKPLVYSEYHEPYLREFPYAQRFAYMPRLFFYGSVDAMSKDNSVSLEFVYRGAENYAYTENESGVEHRGFASVKWQGTSSQAYEKKNYTIKLYDDEALSSPLNIEFKSSWGTHNKYVLKANHIDGTHARNICSAKLWGGAVKSRTSSDEYLTRLNTLVNGGAIDGYPVLLFINDEYRGLYTLNIPKDAYMFGMNGEGKEAILCGESHEDATRFKASALLDESDWTIEYKSDSFTNEELITSFNKIQSACALQGEEFKTEIEKVCDVNSVIDYIIYLLMFHMPDNYDKNMLMATYDGNYWFASMYDMDTSFGINWDGTSIYNASSNIDVEDSFIFYNRLLKRVYQNYYDELKARYNQLVTSTLSVGNVASVINNFVVKVPRPVFNQEPMLYPSIPNSSIGANDMIMFYHLRSEMVDTSFNQ